MEGVRWYTHSYGDSTAVIASFDLTARRICISREQLRQSPDASALVRHAVEQLTLSIRATREAAAKRAEYASRH